MISNESKTQVMYIDTTKRNSKQSFSKHHITLDNININLSNKVSNIGTIISSNLNMTDFINNKIKNDHCNLHKVRLIRKSLTLYSSKLLVNALVMSTLDYCSILLNGFTASQMKPLN